MCGIAGFLLSGRPPEGALEAMTRALTHRGPDGEGFFLEGGAGLGHRRLSIIDLEGGAQPMGNEDGAVQVVFNGEIYNFRELAAGLAARGHRLATHSDTEVLCHLYEEEGEAFLPRLEGIFAFALYDRRRGRLLLARDPVGVKPLYYAPVPGGLLFGSELKALLAWPGFDRAHDPGALALFLTCEYLPAPLTAFRAARKLPPGHLLLCDGAGTTVQRYWHWCPESAPPGGARGAAERARELVERAVRSQLVSDVPLGVFLSGGVDSTCVAAAMTGAGAQARSFAIGFDDPAFDEAPFAREAAAALGSRHADRGFTEAELLAEVPRLLDHLDEPLADPSIFPTALLARFARGEVTVALGGDGGDELFAGYPTYWVHRDYRRYAAVPGPLRRGALALTDALLPVTQSGLTFAYKLRKFRDGAERPMPWRHLAWMGAWRPEAAGALLEGAGGALEEALAWVPEPPSDDPVTAAQWLDFHTYLPEDILAKVDRATMLASLEARVPLLDPALVSFAFGLPPGLRLKGRRGKLPLREAFGPRLPQGFFERPKRGFGIPLSRWLCGPLRPFAEELLSPEAARAVPFLDPAPARRLFAEHLAGRADHRKPLWAHLCLAHWARRWGVT